MALTIGLTWGALEGLGFTIIKDKNGESFY